MKKKIQYIIPKLEVTQMEELDALLQTASMDGKIEETMVEDDVSKLGWFE